MGRSLGGGKTVDVQTLADILEADNAWLAHHYSDLVERYAGKVVAIEAGEIVAIGDSWEEISQLFEQSDREIMPLIIEVPRPEQLKIYGFERCQALKDRDRVICRYARTPN